MTQPCLQLTPISEQVEHIITITATASYETSAGGNICCALVVLLTLCLFLLFVNTSSAVKCQSALSLAEAVSSRPLTAKAPVNGQFFCGQSGIGTGYLQAYRLSPVSIILPVLHVHSCITDTIQY